MRRQLALSAIQIAGIVLLFAGAYLVSIPVGLLTTGLALLAIGWALDRS